MAKPLYTLDKIDYGMPAHPVVEDRPLMWLTKGDQWWFRRRTNSLIPKKGMILSANTPVVRYVVCAIKHKEPTGFDWTMWQEIEVVNPGGETSIVSLSVTIPPSFVETEDLLDKSLQVATIAFNEIYIDPIWISEYEHPIEDKEEEENGEL